MEQIIIALIGISLTLTICLDRGRRATGEQGEVDGSGLGVGLVAKPATRLFTSLWIPCCQR